MSTRYSVGQMNQLADALEAADFTPDDVTKLRCAPQLGTFRNVLRGQVEIVVVKHIIDLDADPFVPDGSTVEEHVKGGQFEWDPVKVIPYPSPDQEAGRVIRGDKLREHLKAKTVLNADLLDYLLKNPTLIPEDWKGKFVFFWGTIYRDPDGRLYVRYLRWGGGQWRWVYRWLGGGWDSDDPAAVRASN